MKKILILAPYCSLPGEPNFNRFLYISYLLSDCYDVTLLTSNFRHYDKTFRNGFDFSSLPFKIVLIDEPGYVNNVSFYRLYSHFVFSKNFKNWFSRNCIFDLVYSAFPLIETNIILSKFKKTFNFKLVIDVQDVWPESICSVFPFLDYLPDSILPFSRKANYAYKSADALVAVSQTYLNRALSVNQTVPNEVVYIGSDFKTINEAEPSIKDSGKFVLVYIGTLSFSYDVETIILAVNQLVELGYPIDFHIFGSGPFESNLKTIAGKSVFFHGFVNLNLLYSFIKSADVAVNALSKSAKQSITNKLSDFLSIGIPILNSQSNPEVLDLLKTVHNANYEAGNVEDAKLKIIGLFNSRDSLSFYPNSNFDRKAEYGKIKEIIRDLLL